MALTIVTIRGRFLKPVALQPETDGPALVPARGRVTFVLSTALQDPETNDIVAPVHVAAVLDETGSFVTKLVATDDVGVQPDGVSYLVTENIRGASSRSYSIDIPHTATDLHLADLAPLVPGPIVFGYALQSALSAETSRAMAVEADKLDIDDPAVTNARTPTGPAGGVLSGDYPDPEFAVPMATAEELAGSTADGLSNANAYTDGAVTVERDRAEAAEAGKLDADDPAVTDARPPTGPAGGVLAGDYPDPDFAVPMATQAALDTVEAAKADTSYVDERDTTVQSSVSELSDRVDNDFIPYNRLGDTVAQLDGGVPQSHLLVEQLPEAAYARFVFAADEANRLEQLGLNRGDFARQDDNSHVYLFLGIDASNPGNWIDLGAAYIPLTEKGAPLGVATLDVDGKILASQLSALAITDTFPVDSQAEMLALTAERGDLAIRSDLTATFILADDDPTILANWIRLPVPTDAVLSVNGRTGVVTGLAEQSALTAEAATARSAETANATAIANEITRATTAEATKQAHDADLDAIAALDSTTAGVLVTDGAGWFRKTYAQLKTALGLVKADVGLGNVDNTSDANKPVSTAQAAADAAAVNTAETFATGVVGTEASRAMAAEALRVRPRGAWTALTAYAVNDIFTNSGGVYLVTDAFTSGATFDAAGLTVLQAPTGTYALKGRVFDIRDYGAVADCPLTGSTTGATDNTAAIQAAITDCYNGGGGIVYCPTPTNGKCYGLFGALSSTAAVNAAQILIPYAAQPTGPVVIRLLGDTSFGSFPSTPAGGFAQAPNSQGTIFRTTATANTGGWGAIIDVDNNNSGFANIHLIVERVNFRLPDNPGVSAIRGIWFSALEVPDCMVDVPSATGSIVQPTHTKQAGIYFPENNLQGPASARRLAVIGCYAGFYHSEHFSGDEIEIFACAVGHKIGLGYHAANIGRLGIWWCPIVMQVDTGWNGSTAPGPVPLNIGLLDVEIPPASGTYSAMWWALSYLIDDSHSGLIFGRPVPYNYIQAMTGLLTSVPPVNGAGKAQLTPARRAVPRIARVDYTGGTITLAASTSWATLQTALDVTVAAAAGDWVKLALSFRADAPVSPVDTVFDAVTLVSGAAVHWVSGGAGGASSEGVEAWFTQGKAVNTSFLYDGHGEAPLYQVTATDVSTSGTVTFRLMVRQLAAVARTIPADANHVVSFSAHNLGGSY